MSDAESFLHPRIEHRLVAAVRFLDAFTGKTVGVPLDVRINRLPTVDGPFRLPWVAGRALDGETHRFLLTNRETEPRGSVDLVVTAPGGEYADFEPRPLALPLPRTGSGTVTDFDAFRVERALWPTRLFRLPPGETAIVGDVRASSTRAPLAGYRIVLTAVGTTVRPGTHSQWRTYTDAQGEFVVRAPGVVERPAHSVQVTTLRATFEVRAPPDYVRVVPPRTPTGEVSFQVGKVNVFRITV